MLTVGTRVLEVFLLGGLQEGILADQFHLDQGFNLTKLLHHTLVVLLGNFTYPRVPPLRRLKLFKVMGNYPLHRENRILLAIKQLVGVLGLSHEGESRKDAVVDCFPNVVTLGEPAMVCLRNSLGTLGNVTT